MAAQTFIRWSRLGVWERLLVLVQERGVQLGMTFLDGTKCVPSRRPQALRPRGDSARRGSAEALGRSRA
jgi:hypothetical protein